MNVLSLRMKRARHAIPIHTRYNNNLEKILFWLTRLVFGKSKVHETMLSSTCAAFIKMHWKNVMCIVVIDAERKLESQDANIISQAEKQGKALSFCEQAGLDSRKTPGWQGSRKKWIEAIAPSITCLSLMIGSRAAQIESSDLFRWSKKSAKKNPKPGTERAMLPEIVHYPPPSVKGVSDQIRATSATPHAFVRLFCNLPQYVKWSLTSVFENRIAWNQLWRYLYDCFSEKISRLKPSWNGFLSHALMKFQNSLHPSLGTIYSSYLCALIQNLK